MRVLYPISIDRWSYSLTNVLREIALRSPDMQFYSFSNPLLEEDRRLGEQFWAHPHIHPIRQRNLLTRSFDIVHYRAVTPQSLAAVALAWARSGGRGRRIFTAASIPPDFPVYHQYQAAVHLADVLIAVSKAVAESIREQFGRTVDAVIPNGAALDFFDPAAAHPLDASLNLTQPYVLFVGVLTWNKRPDVVLKLATLLPDLCFVLVGGAFSDEERTTYAQQIAALPNVRYLGLQPRATVRDLMAHAAALVFPSQREGLPLTVIEAIAMGLPVLAQPRSSLPELVHAGLTGWLLPVDQPEAWASRLQTIINWTAEERRHFAQRARAHAVEHYGWDSIARQYRALYQRAHP
ncbi:MAG: glycosyltransferase family 4 protein [Chloroflexaceae bacterium]|nr:glycosyltransferase family 4 protein [Chloroflexaceae bacterium]